MTNHIHFLVTPYGVNAWGDESWLLPHDEYLSLGKTFDERYHVYRDLFKVELSEENLHLFRKSAHYNQPMSDDRFREQIENKYGFQFGYAKRGRPNKQQV